MEKYWTNRFDFTYDYRMSKVKVVDLGIEAEEVYDFIINQLDLFNPVRISFHLDSNELNLNELMDLIIRKNIGECQRDFFRQGLRNYLKKKYLSYKEKAYDIISLFDAKELNDEMLNIAGDFQGYLIKTFGTNIYKEFYEKSHDIKSLEYYFGDQINVLEEDFNLSD